MEDIQNKLPEQQIPIDQVGVTNLRYPIVVLDRCNEKQQTFASITASVDLPHHFKGTHMSRFIEILNKHRGEVTMRTIPLILKEMKKKLNSKSARIEVEFPYFLERKAPQTKIKALMDYDCTFIGNLDGKNSDFVLGVKVPVTSLCPCSKAISEYGAHNQRGNININIRSCCNEKGELAFVWIEELIDIAEKSASAPVYPLLKRSDERYVTMLAYDNPVFVEDIVRKVAIQLKHDERVSWFKIRAVNQESIHNHSAFACIEWSR